VDLGDDGEDVEVDAVCEEEAWCQGEDGEMGQGLLPELEHLVQWRCASAEGEHGW
jgi:hypothetical protein